jgi:hypothetical protein
VVSTSGVPPGLIRWAQQRRGVASDADVAIGKHRVLPASFTGQRAASKASTASEASMASMAPARGGMVKVTGVVLAAWFSAACGGFWV